MNILSLLDALDESLVGLPSIEDESNPGNALFEAVLVECYASPLRDLVALLFDLRGSERDANTDTLVLIARSVKRLQVASAYQQDRPALFISADGNIELVDGFCRLEFGALNVPAGHVLLECKSLTFLEGRAPGLAETQPTVEEIGPKVASDWPRLTSEFELHSATSLLVRPY